MKLTKEIFELRIVERELIPYIENPEAESILRAIRGTILFLLEDGELPIEEVRGLIQDAKERKTELLKKLQASDKESYIDEEHYLDTDPAPTEPSDTEDTIPSSETDPCPTWDDDDGGPLFI